LLRSPADSNHDTFQILHHVIIGKSEHAISAGCKPFIASAIAAETGFEIVALAIDFDDEPAGMRDEVGDVIAHWALPAKAEPSEPICLQVTP